jgi:hypothetical protein
MRTMDRTDDVKWAAGFFDGEGCIIIIAKPNVANPTHYSLHIEVSQKSRKPLEIYQKLWRGNITGPRSDGTYMWQCNARLASTALAEMLPHLRYKTAQAEVAMEFQSCRRSGQLTPIKRALKLSEDVADQLRLRELKSAN